MVATAVRQGWSVAARWLPGVHWEPRTVGAHPQFPPTVGAARDGTRKFAGGRWRRSAVAVGFAVIVVPDRVGVPRAVFRRRQPTHNRTALTAPTSADSSSGHCAVAIGGGGMIPLPAGAGNGMIGRGRPTRNHLFSPEPGRHPGQVLTHHDQFIPGTVLINSSARGVPTSTGHPPTPSPSPAATSPPCTGINPDPAPPQ